jgi:hypothetical protein
MSAATGGLMMTGCAIEGWTDTVAATCRPIRWRTWADATIDALSGHCLPWERDHAIDMLYGIADYLDHQYDGGYDGIALTPRERFTLTYDH